MITGKKRYLFPSKSVFLLQQHDFLPFQLVLPLEVRMLFVVPPAFARPVPTTQTPHLYQPNIALLITCICAVSLIVQRKCTSSMLTN